MTTKTNAGPPDNNPFALFANFLNLVLRRCAEYALIRIFLPQSENSERVKAAAATLSALQHQAIQGDRKALGELVLLSSLAANYTTQASRAQPKHARYYAQLTPAWPLMVFRNRGLNRWNEELLEEIQVGSLLELSNKTPSGLEDRSAALAALLTIYIKVRRAIAARHSGTTSAPQSQTSPKSDTREIIDAYKDSYRYRQGHEDDLKYWWDSAGEDSDSYLKKVFGWARRNRVKN